VARREQGEPLAWVTGYTRFLGRKVRVQRGVYVPRPQTEILALRAIASLPAHGIAADLCTGSGAVAAALLAEIPGARVVATDIDPAACRSATENGVEVYLGHLGDPLPSDLRGLLDVVVAVPPYVPTDALRFLPTDARDYEPIRALDGGHDGTDVLVRVVRAASRLLRPGGTLLLELGGDQDALLAGILTRAGFQQPTRLEDAEGDLRGIQTVLLDR